jgi:hypothetical protein
VSDESRPAAASGSDLDPPDLARVLGRTPALLDAWLRDLPDAWVQADEGPGTFSPWEVVGHLVHGERTDWIPRAELILGQGTARAFDPFDRHAQRVESAGVSMAALLDEFTTLRAGNLVALAALDTSPSALERRGLHPDLGEVTLGNLLATWVVHDQTHVAQIARVLGKRLTGRVGPWRAYLPLLDR